MLIYITCVCEIAINTSCIYSCTYFCNIFIWFVTNIQHLVGCIRILVHEIRLNHCNITIQYIPRNMHTVFALLCFVVVIHWLIFPYPSGLLHWHCGNLTIAPVPAKQPWWIWINTSCEFIMKDCVTTTKQSTTKPCAYFLGYTVYVSITSGTSVIHSVYFQSMVASLVVHLCNFMNTDFCPSLQRRWRIVFNDVQRWFRLVLLLPQWSNLK